MPRRRRIEFSMIILAFLLFPFFEIFTAYRFAQIYSFGDLVLWTISSLFLGMAILKIQGKVGFQQAQIQLAQGQIPTGKILHHLFILLGGLLFLIPGIISDLLGLLCILPGTRHLLIWSFQRSLEKNFKSGKVRFFSQGFGGPRPNPFQEPFRQRQDNWNSPPERDAQVIDIEPIRIQHQNKKNDFDQ